MNSEDFDSLEVRLEEELHDELELLEPHSNHIPSIENISFDLDALLQNERSKGKVNGREPTTDTNTATAKEEFQQTANTAINAEKEDLQPTASVTVVKEELPEVSVCFEPVEADFEEERSEDVRLKVEPVVDFEGMREKCLKEHVQEERCDEVIEHVIKIQGKKRKTDCLTEAITDEKKKFQ